MLAPSSMPTPAPTAWQTLFVAILPSIRNGVTFAFRHLPSDEREDAVQEALANACVAVARLAALGQLDRAFPTPLARFAVAQVRAGRRVGMPAHNRDALSPRAGRTWGFVVERLDRDKSWRDLVADDSRTPVPDQVSFRIDYPAWLARLSDRTRQIACALAHGDSTQTVARQFGLSEPRVSQLRRELNASWQRFHGDGAPAADGDIRSAVA